MTVTVNGIEIDTDESKAITRAISKAKREEKKQRDVDNANKRQALLHAKASGFSILTRKLSGEMCSRWELHRVGTGSPYVRQVDDYNRDGITYTIETPGGRGGGRE